MFFFLSFMSLAGVTSTEWPFLASPVRAPSLCSSQVSASCINNFYTYLHILSFVRLQSTHTGFFMLFLGFLLVQISYFSAWPLKNQPSALYLFSLQVCISWGSFNQIPKQIKFCWLEIQACDPAVNFFDFLSWSWTPPSYSQSLFEESVLKTMNEKHWVFCCILVPDLFWDTLAEIIMSPIQRTWRSIRRFSDFMLYRLHLMTFFSTQKIEDIKFNH